MTNSLYAPLDTPKPVGEAIWLVDGQAIKFFGMNFSTRATIVQLEGGGLWVHSPTKLSNDLRARVDALGDVAHLVAPNWIHYAYVNEWQRAYPKAVSWAAPGVEARAKKHGMSLRFDHPLAQDAPQVWADEIDQMIVRGSKVHQEAVFFHRVSRTLILTDLIENFDKRALGPAMKIATKIGGIQAPDGAMPRDMRMTFTDRDALREDVERMIAWKPERVILSHGNWFETEAEDHLRHAFSWLLG